MAEPSQGRAGAAVHISSLIVYLRPEAAERVVAAILALGGAEIAAREAGKLVVVLEAEHEGVLADHLTKINLMPDVYVAALVYHQVEEAVAEAGNECEERHEA
ncbi:MAG: chaperone NapD [Tistlia sp.]|uniref:chaperone NapD n=1 Tax=Tistlia sp. TaxID=3057121 RepID=UPI0034A503FB